MSASISPSDALAALRRGEELPPETILTLAEREPSRFFRDIIEPLADSFDADDAARYEKLMRAWLAERALVQPRLPDSVEAVYVLSRVTLGADIKITSVILDAMKRRFPKARVIFVANRKSAELFAEDRRIEHLQADYPRSGSVTSRIAFAERLASEIKGRNRIVVDPDSRMTQLGLAPVCEPESYFHFRSRVAGGASNLADLTQAWVLETFGVEGNGYIAPGRVPGGSACATVSFGVGENESKRFAGSFEADVIRRLAASFECVYLDRGVGGEEGRRVTAAVAEAGCEERVKFWEGSFAGFASLISQSDLYVGYDSAGQHAAAAAGVPLVTIFRGAASGRFRQRWAPSGPGRIHTIDADLLGPSECLAELGALIN